MSGGKFCLMPTTDSRKITRFCTEQGPTSQARSHCSFPLPNPALNGVPSLADLFIHNSHSLLAVQPSHIPGLLNAISRPDMALRNCWELLLILPQQLADVAHGNWQHDPAGSDTNGEGYEAAEEDVAVSGDDRARHGGYQNVYRAWHQLFSGLWSGCERGDGAGEAVFQVQEGIHYRVHFGLSCYNMGV
jgi:hypothetical protein